MSIVGPIFLQTLRKARLRQNEKPARAIKSQPCNGHMSWKPWKVPWRFESPRKRSTFFALQAYKNPQENFTMTRPRKYMLKYCYLKGDVLLGSFTPSYWLSSAGYLSMAGVLCKDFCSLHTGKKTKDGKKVDCKTSTPGSMSVGGLWYEWIYNNAILPPKQYPISEGYSNPIRTNTCD